MEPTNTELSNRTAALFSWLEFIAMVLVLLSAAFEDDSGWFMMAAVILFASAFVYRLVADWNAGRKKAVRRRLIASGIFLLILAIFLIWRFAL